jgi:hypothetical protein
MLAPRLGRPQFRQMMLWLAQLNGFAAGGDNGRLVINEAMQVCGYAGVSTAEQANNGDSLDTQQITGYAMMKGWEVAEFFVERGVSGSVPLTDRPEGGRLLAAEPAEHRGVPKRAPNRPT